MAYSNTLNYVVGDTLPELTVTLKDKNAAASGQTLDTDNSATWAPINVTGATVRLRIRALGGTTITDTLSMTLSDATNGVCITTFTTDCFPSAGTYEGEVEITFSGGGKQTVNDLVKFKVRDDFD
jgi:hypothetical protein